MNRTYHRSRRALGTALLLFLVVLPFLRMNGESVLRFDIPSLRLHFFGATVWMEDFFLVLIVVLFLTFLALFLTIALGRIWCGWLCPQTVLMDTTRFMETAAVRGGFSRSLAYLLGAIAGALIAAGLVGYFVSPYDAGALMQSGGPSAKIAFWSWAVLTILLFLDLVALRRRFCATVCPYAKMQGVLFDDRTMIVAFDSRRQQECMHCEACLRVCPVGIDIRDGLQSECIHCAECADACSDRMKKRKRGSLIDYAFGSPAGHDKGARTSLYLTGAMTLLSLLLFLYLLWSSVPFDATLLPAAHTEALIGPDGSLSNTYLISLRNTGSTDLDLSLAVASDRRQVRSSPERVTLPRGQEIMKVPLNITIAGTDTRAVRVLPLTVTIRDVRNETARVKKVSFILPEAQ